MKRREFIAGLGGAVAWPLAARGQQAFGFIGAIGGSAATRSDPLAGGRYIAAFLQGLSETGYAEGRNVTIEYRDPRLNNELSAVVSDLVGRRVTVIAALNSTAAVLAAKAATQTIPIVFRIGSDPIANGIVPSLNRPGGNITGITTLGVELGAKRLEILRELLPPGATVVLLANPTNANAARETEETQGAAHILGVRLLTLHVSSPSDIDAAFATMARQDVDGLMTAADPFMFQQSDRIIALVARRAIPAAAPTR